MKQRPSFKNMPKRQAKKFVRLKLASERQRVQKKFGRGARAR